MSSIPDIDAVKARMKAMWMSGDYAEFSRFMAAGGRAILARWRVAPGSDMLDVACGAGQTAIPAALAGVRVTGIDIATNLIERARRRAAEEGVAARFDEGDAEALPYPDASFDVVLSAIGVMFAPRPERAAAELLRVCRPGGRILLANWTPEGMVGELFRLGSRYSPPPPGVPAPTEWGREDIVRARLGAGVRSVSFERIIFPEWEFPFGPAEVVDWFRAHFGPTIRAFAAAGPAGEAAIRAELEGIFTRANGGSHRRTRLDAEILLVDAVRA